MTSYQTPEPAARSSAQPSLGELVSRISENVTSLIKSEIDLTKAKGKRLAAKAGVGIALLAGAGVLALYALGLILAALTRLLALALPLWASQLIVALVLLVLVAVMAALGAQRLKAAQADVPDTKANLTEDLATAKAALRSGLRKGDLQ